MCLRRPKGRSPFGNPFREYGCHGYANASSFLRLSLVWVISTKKCSDAVWGKGKKAFEKVFSDRCPNLSSVIFSPKCAGQGGRCPLAGCGAEPCFDLIGFHKCDFANSLRERGKSPFPQNFSFWVAAGKGSPRFSSDFSERNFPEKRLPQIYIMAAASSTARGQGNGRSAGRS